MDDKKEIPKVVRYHNSKEYERITRRTLSVNNGSIYPLRDILSKVCEGSSYPLRETLDKVCKGSSYPLRETLDKEREKFRIKGNLLSKLNVYPY